MLLVYISLSFLLGLWLGNYWHQPVFFALLPVGVVSLVIHIVKKPNGRIWLIAGLVCICCVLGIIRTAYSGGEEIPEQLREYNDSGTVELHGMVAENPQSGSTTTRLVVSVSEITTDTAHNDISGKVLVYLPQHEHYEYGDVIAVSGGLQTPVNFADFDYRQYLADQGIYSVLWYPHIELLDSGQGNVCKSLLYTVQNTGAEILDILLPQPQASLARALLLGQRDSLPDDVREEFAISGVSHILAISGLHLGIIAGIFIYTGIALMGRKRYLYVWVAMVLVWLYALLTGMNPPVVRGAIMISLFLVAEALGRQRSSLTSLVFAAAVMTAITPSVLWSLSFQMSVLAMAGIILLSPLLMKWERALLERFVPEENRVRTPVQWVGDSFAVTLGAVLFIIPLTAYHFGMVSLAGPLVTLLVLPVLPLCFLLGMGVLLLGFIFVPLAQPVAWLLYLVLSYILKIVGAFSSLSVSALQLGAVPLFAILICYLVLAFLAITLTRRTPLFSVAPGISSFNGVISLKRISALLLALAVCVWYTALTMPDDRLYVYFLDVGEGDAILLQQGTCQVLIDGGPSPELLARKLGEYMPFWDRTLELVLVTHPHNDHLNGLMGCTGRFTVERVMMPDVEYSSSLYTAWKECIAEREIPVLMLNEDMKITLSDEITLNVFAGLVSPEEKVYSVDEAGLVVQVNSGQVQFLLMADTGTITERRLIYDREIIQCTVVKAGHHGSSTSSSEGFLSVVAPDMAVVSCGEQNRYGHPSPEVMKRLEIIAGEGYVFRTDLQGTIQCCTDGTDLYVFAD